uniref:Uncharacterized protein n=1 Tax=Opuntia streptacantha TaxID=393608 RepID=A0A7C9E561_OPUST
MDSEESSRYGRIKRWSFNKVSCVQNVDVLDQSIPPVDANSKATGSPRVRRIKRPSGSWITDVPDLASPSLVPPATETKYEFARQLLRNYREFIAICGGSVSELKHIEDRANFLQRSIVSKGRTEDGRSALLASASDIFELAQLTTEKEHLMAKEAYCDPLRHSLLTLLRKEDVLPVECIDDVTLAIMLKDYYQWKGKLYVSNAISNHEACKDALKGADLLLE